jgi:hypothetical protein
MFVVVNILNTVLLRIKLKKKNDQPLWNLGLQRNTRAIIQYKFDSRKDLNDTQS